MNYELWEREGARGKMADDFRQLLQEKGVIVFDGAMGTILQDKDIPQGSPLEELNLTEPNKVADVHLSYAEVGVDVTVK